MVSRSARILIEVVIGLLAAASLLAGVAVWRLSAGPISVDFLTPYLEGAFAGGESGLKVEIGETIVTWEGWARTLDLRARRVIVRNPDGSAVAAVPEISVALSLRALMRGMVAPTEIEVIDARVTLAREADGHFELATQSTAAEVQVEGQEAEFSGVLPALVDIFLRQPDYSTAIGYLSAVRVVDGQFIVIDRRLRALWVAPKANMEMRRHKRGVAVFLGLEVAVGREMANANLAVLFDQPEQEITVAARLSDFHADAVAAVVPLPAALSGIHVPLEANVRATLTPSGHVTEASFDARGGAGEILAPPYLPEPRTVSGVRFRGTFDGAAHRVEVTAAELRFGSADAPGPALSMTSVVEGLGGDLEITAAAELSAVPADDLGQYWPEILAPGGRAWTLENISGGVAENGRLSVTARVPDGDFEALELIAFEGGFDLKDMTVRYLDSMPAITEVSGRASFGPETLRFQLDQGREGDLRFQEVGIDLLDLSGDSRMELDGRIAGPLRAALEVLGPDRLDLLDRADFDPASARGDAEIRLAVDLPLEDDLAFEMVDIHADADIRGGAIEGFLLGRDASDMDLALTADNQGLSLKGPLALAGVPALIDWQEDFTGAAPTRTRLSLDFPNLDAAGQERLEVDLEPYLSGPVAASVLATVAQDGTGTLNLAVNLGDALLSLPFLHWRKPAAQAGTLRLSLAVKDEAIVGLHGFDLDAGTLRARGDGDLQDDSRDFRALRFEELIFRGTTLRNVRVAREGDGLVLDLGRGVLDAAAFLNERAEAREAELAPAAGGSTDGSTDGSADGGSDGGAGPREPETPLRITAARLDAVYFDEGRYLRDVNLDLERSAAGWERVVLHGVVPKALWMRRSDGSEVEGATEAVVSVKGFDMEFGPAEEGGYRLDVRMNDMGAALRALGIIDTIEGGDLELRATSPGPAPYHPLAGRVEAQDYVLRDAPVMAKLLSLASFTGISSVLSGGGLKFQRLVGEFTLDKGVVSTDLIRAYGNALGLTAQGRLDFVRDEIDMDGTVVPAYTVNRIIGEIPLLGRLLTGGEGEGLVAVVYGIKGKLSDPHVRVNPLSMLTPGFLRGLFGLSPRSGGEGEEDVPRVFPREIER